MVRSVQTGADGPIRQLAKVGEGRLDRPVGPVRVGGSHPGRNLRPGELAQVGRRQSLKNLRPVIERLAQLDPATVDQCDGPHAFRVSRGELDDDVPAPGLSGHDRADQPQIVDHGSDVGRCGRRVVPGIRYGGLAVAAQIDRGHRTLRLAGQGLRDLLPQKRIRGQAVDQEKPWQLAVPAHRPQRYPRRAADGERSRRTGLHRTPSALGRRMTP